MKSAGLEWDGSTEIRGKLRDSKTCVDFIGSKGQRWQEYTEELYRKDLHDPGKHSGLITHLEPDI